MKIADIQVFHAQPQGPNARLTIVKVQTDQPGLHGWGCATFTQRHRAVEAAVMQHLRPLLLGRDPSEISDLWELMHVSGYWRNGPVLGSALGGIDMALWDIKGKVAGLPLYQLWGGRCRNAVTPYVHATAPSKEELLDMIEGMRAKGPRHFRCQIGALVLTKRARTAPRAGDLAGHYYDPRQTLREVPAMLAFLRERLPAEVELLYDVHERLAPADAAQLLRLLEPLRLFFLEDPLAPEDLGWLPRLRAAGTTPIALGELFNHPLELMPIIARREIDFIRCHIAQIGGLTPALKLAHACEPFGVRTAWHCPADVSPLCAAAYVHLDMAVPNFGIQEWAHRVEAEYDLFPGCPRLADGLLRPSDAPGLGVDVNEALLEKFPPSEHDLDWTEARWPDGTLARP